MDLPSWRPGEATHLGFKSWGAPAGTAERPYFRCTSAAYSSQDRDAGLGLFGLWRHPAFKAQPAAWANLGLPFYQPGPARKIPASAQERTATGDDLMPICSSDLECLPLNHLKELNRIFWLFICFLIIKCRVPMLRCPGFRMSWLWPWLVVQHASSTQLSASGHRMQISRAQGPQGTAMGPRDPWCPDFSFILWGFYGGSRMLPCNKKQHAFEEQETLLQCTSSNKQASSSILLEKQEGLC